MFKVRYIFGYRTRPSHPSHRVGRYPDRPTFGIAYPRTDRPNGTPRRACATGSHPKVTPRDGSPSPRAGHIDRTHSHGRARANVPWDGRDAHGTAHHGTARKAANAPTRCLRVPCGPLCGRASGIRPTRLRCRLPLLTASACRARATQAAADQAAAWQRLGQLRACVGVDRRPRRELACAHRCSFSAAPFCSCYLGRANDPLGSSTTIDSRRKVLL